MPVADAVHVGFDADVEDKDPDAPLSDHEYVYGLIPPDTLADKLTLCPMSILPDDLPIVTDGSDATLTVSVEEGV